MTEPTSSPSASAGASGRLDNIPLSVRMLVYGVSFLLVVLAGLPWLFYQIDVHFPAVSIEIGWARGIGVVLFAVSLLCYLVASYVLTTKGKGPFVEFDPPKELVIEGPYRFVRNPIVCFLLGAMLGEAIALSSTGILLMFLLFMLLGHLQVVRVEEPLLRERYGKPYEEYCQRVPRWIPRWPRSEPATSKGG